MCCRVYTCHVGDDGVHHVSVVVRSTGGQLLMALMMMVMMVVLESLSVQPKCLYQCIQTSLSPVSTLLLSTGIYD